MERRPEADAVPMTPADVMAMSQNMALLLEAAGEATSAYLVPEEKRDGSAVPGEAFSEMTNSLRRLTEHWTSEPERAVAAQARLGAEWFDLWANTLKRMQGEEAGPVAVPDPRDKRFASADWSDNPFFDYLKQAYLVTSRWADSLARDARMDPHERHKAEFYVRQLSSALAPSNFLATNPDLLRQTVEEKGANLVRGMKMLAEDIKAGHGELRLRQTDPTGFEVGVNIANTPGKVVFRNELMELLQYAPSTPTVLKRPLLIVPPWINKYYVLDLNPEKSFIRWAVAQGLTVFCISWVNPDERHAEKGFGDYMREGVFAALDAIEDATGETDVATIGYCVGGTMLAVALAYAAATGDKRISSATFFTTQVDFTHPGDLKVFVDEEQVKAVEEGMAKRGYLEGSRMANAFNMLRPNDLIWPYVINNYLKGKMPIAFDLLYWNSDSTRMPAANHSFYLRGCYLNNMLAKGEMIVENVRLDLKKVRIPIFNLAAREDHIAPAKSAFLGSGLFGGKVDFVLAGSGHIAGVVNPADKPKYQFWTGGPPEGELDSWIADATEHPGSWWPYWFAWIGKQAPERVPARVPGEGKLPALEDAPGSYVKVRC